jgi:hypothetical protein
MQVPEGTNSRRIKLAALLAVSRRNPLGKALTQQPGLMTLHGGGPWHCGLLCGLHFGHDK